MSGRTLVADPHVHLHPGVDAGAWLDVAAANLEAAARRLDAGPDADLLLGLTQTAGQDGPDRWPPELAGGWTLSTLDPADPGLCTARRTADGHELRLLAGRQIACRERLEVLALGLTGDPIPDGQPLREVLLRTEGAGALPVVPWGFGKWWGARGRLMLELVDAAAAGELPRFAVGDLGGRPRFGREPGPLQAAAAAGLTILPGSDPLPLAGGWRVAGSTALRVRTAGPALSAADVLAALAAAGPRPRHVRGRRPLPAFLADQVRMQARLRRADPLQPRPSVEALRES